MTSAYARAIAAHSAQDLETAWAEIGEAARAAPDDPATAFANAQIAYESWRPAADLFERATTLAPDRPDAWRNRALALASEGRAAEADELLADLVRRQPQWIDGLNALATLRQTQGDADWDRAFGAAPGARLAWFAKLAAAKRWDSARAVLAPADQSYRAVRMARAYLDAESGASDDPALFAEFANSGDAGTDLARVRHALRVGRPEDAAAIVEPLLGGPAAAMFWPYASLVWRLLGENRAGWLDGDPPSHWIVDMELDLNGLAPFLRSLHSAVRPYPEQSVRGGTQTERNLLLHHDPRIAEVRRQIVAAVDEVRDTITPQPGHPLSDRKPDAIRFAGSWSVRLTANGFHSAHTHPLGWLSSALYIALPEGDGQQGYLALGLPPPELGLALEPQTLVEPKPGRLVLFPSTTWHGTLPFDDGERLTMAFDVTPQEKTA